MTSERHAVASKVIATVDDLEQIAADDNADVAALHGWRRELFGEAALALKHGRLALAIEKGRVVRVDRDEAVYPVAAHESTRRGLAPSLRSTERCVSSINILLPLQLEAHRALVRLHRGAEFAVVVDVEPRGVAQAERGRRAGVGAILAFADALEGDALAAEADGESEKFCTTLSTNLP